MQSDNMPPIQPPTPPQPPVPPASNVPSQTELLGYDANGTPLYGTPTTQVEPQVQSPASQPVVPIRTTEAPRLINTNPSAVRQDVHHEDIDRRHAESMRQYPYLNLSENEYVIAAVRRHPIGMLAPVVIGVFLICLLLTGVFSYPSIQRHFALGEDAPSVGVVALIGIILVALVAAFTYISVWIYRANRFFLTNESIIQEIQTSLFARREQTISIGNVEDASFSQTGMLQSMFNYGSIRLSTEGEETTYRMQFVSNPREQVAQLTNAVEDFKNGRQVDGL